jgi:hypothetical protein
MPNSCVFTIHEFRADLNYKIYYIIYIFTLNNIYTHNHTHMDLVFIIPVLTIVLLSIYRFVEFKFITHEFKPNFTYRNLSLSFRALCCQT